MAVKTIKSWCDLLVPLVDKCLLRLGFYKLSVAALIFAVRHDFCVVKIHLSRDQHEP